MDRIETPQRWWFEPSGDPGDLGTELDECDAVQQCVCSLDKLLQGGPLCHPCHFDGR